jgi:Leucine-rich repeat (LRR) protein
MLQYLYDLYNYFFGQRYYYPKGAIVIDFDHEAKVAADRFEKEELENAETIFVSRNDLENLSELMNRINSGSLKRLIMSNLNLRDVPEEIMNCQNIVELDLSVNNLTKVPLPQVQFSYNKIRILNLSHNLLEVFPEEFIYKYPKLENLNLSHNNFVVICPSILKYKKEYKYYYQYFEDINPNFKLNIEHNPNLLYPPTTDSDEAFKFFEKEFVRTEEDISIVRQIIIRDPCFDCGSLECMAINSKLGIAVCHKCYKHFHPQALTLGLTYWYREEYRTFRGIGNQKAHQKLDVLFNDINKQIIDQKKIVNQLKQTDKLDPMEKSELEKQIKDEEYKLYTLYEQKRNIYHSGTIRKSGYYDYVKQELDRIRCQDAKLDQLKQELLF